MAQELYENKNISINEICDPLKIFRATLYRYISGAGSSAASCSRS